MSRVQLKHSQMCLMYGIYIVQRQLGAFTRLTERTLVGQYIYIYFFFIELEPITKLSERFALVK